MSLNTQTKAIDGHTCVSIHYPGMEGLKIWTQLVKILGPSVALIAKGLGAGVDDLKSLGDIGDLDIDTEKMFSALSEALVMASDKFDDDLIELLILRILQCTKVDNKEVDRPYFDILFAGNYGFLFKLLAFTLKSNYSSFLVSRGPSTNSNPNPSLSSVQS